jgi:ribonuclease R
MGDKVRVKLVAANLTKRQLDYEWVLYVEDTADGQSVKPKPKDKKEKQKTKTKPAGKPSPSRKHR